MYRNKIVLLLLIISICMFSCQDLQGQTSVSKIVRVANEKFSLSVYAFRLNPAWEPAYSNQAAHNLNENIFIKKTNFFISNNIVHLSATSFKNENFLTTTITIPWNVTRWWKLHLSVNHDFRVTVIRGNPFPQFHFSDNNFNMTQNFKLQAFGGKKRKRNKNRRTEQAV